MKYLLMICGDESAAEHANDGCGGWTEEMENRGVVVGGAGLRPPDEATTLRVRDDQLLLTDGPFAETKEQIGGFVLIDCADLDEAIEIAAKHPAAGYGTIEIRPLLELPPGVA
ncbi:YciI family protein [Kribbella hippodromi]|uniref:YciI family protein n=1 Tax=Kribbella hippodromi TaxID=434347 RepID=A0ABN2DEC6_9ACTN